MCDSPIERAYKAPRHPCVFCTAETTKLLYETPPDDWIKPGWLPVCHECEQGLIAERLLAAAEDQGTSVREFYKTRIVIDVLSEDGPVAGDMSLADLEYEMDEGHYVGRVRIEQVKQLSGPQMAKNLEQLGSDSGFFELDPDGKELDDE